MNNFTILNDSLQKCNNEQVINVGGDFFEFCQKYYHLYLIHNAMEPATHILSKIDNFEFSVFACFFEDAYEKYQQNIENPNLPWIQVVDNTKNINLIIEKYFPATDAYFKKRMHTAIEFIYRNDTRKKHYRILEAMEIIKDTLNITQPTIEESIDALLTPEIIQILNEFLQTEPIGFYFTIAPIRRALFDGDISTYGCNRKYKYLQLNDALNYKDLQNYIDNNYSKYDEYTFLRELVD